MRVGILGCGYVGIELGKRLLPDHEIFGVRRSASGRDAVEAAGITSVEADVTDGTSLSGVPDVDALVFAASAGGRDAAAARRTYVEGQRTAIETFAARESPPERYIYTSSMGVYGDHDGAWVDETTPLDPGTERARVLVEAERVAREASLAAGMDPTVARLAGLYGPDRYRLERYLDGPVTAGYLNLVHRADAAGAIAWLLTADRGREEVVLIVDDEPVDRRDLADWLADRCGVDRPEKRTVAERLAAGDDSGPATRRLTASKRCANDRLRDLGYEFEYPTYREGYQHAVETYVR